MENRAEPLRPNPFHLVARIRDLRNVVRRVARIDALQLQPPFSRHFFSRSPFPIARPRGGTACRSATAAQWRARLASLLPLERQTAEPQKVLPRNLHRISLRMWPSDRCGSSSNPARKRPRTLAPVAESRFAVAAEACARKALLVDFSVIRDIAPVAAADHVLTPVEEQFHVCGTHRAGRSNTFFLFAGRTSSGRRVFFVLGAHTRTVLSPPPGIWPHPRRSRFDHAWLASLATTSLRLSANGSPRRSATRSFSPVITSALPKSSCTPATSTPGTQ